jgi:predicted nucleotidyltransferase/predicted transcriptional regulator with HTH domain
MLDLRSKTRRKLLIYYFTNPTARLHLRDIAERIGADPSNLSKELARLQREGLFLAAVNGRQKYFQLNTDYALFAEVRSIVTKTIGAVPLLSAALKKVDGIEEAYLYGSFARDQQDAASDIDVLMIGRPGSENLAVCVQRLEKQLGREINYTVLTRNELNERRARKDAFLNNVWARKRILIGGRREEIQSTKGGLGADRALPGKRRQEARFGRKDSRRRR